MRGEPESPPLLGFWEEAAGTAWNLGRIRRLLAVEEDLRGGSDGEEEHDGDAENAKEREHGGNSTAGEAAPRE